MSNPLIERHGWVDYDITGDDNLAYWGILARVNCSTADITVTLPYTQATTPTTAVTVQTDGEIIVIKIDADPLLNVIIEPFSGDNPTNPSNTINGSSANIVLKNQFDYAHFVNNGGVDVEMIGMGTLTLRQIALLSIAKGGLITNDGTAMATLPVGTNGQFLSADSTVTTGLKWITSTFTTSLSALADVDLTSPANNDVLRYDTATSKWVNSTLSSLGAIVTDANGNLNINTESLALTNIGSVTTYAMTPTSTGVIYSSANSLTQNITLPNPLTLSNGTIYIFINEGNATNIMNVLDFANFSVYDGLNTGDAVICILIDKIFNIWAPLSLVSQNNQQAFLATKQNLVPSATTNDIAIFDSLGQVIDSGTSISSIFASQWRGTWNGAGSLYPTFGSGSGAGGAVMAGDIWTVDFTYTFSGTTIYQTTTLRALIDSPAQNPLNWSNEGEPDNKQNKVFTATLNNIATWDNSGNTKDSGIAVSSIPVVATNIKAIYLSSVGNDSTNNGTIISPYLTWGKAESTVTGSSFVYMTDTNTYTGNVTATQSNVNYIAGGNLQNSKVTYTGTVTISGSTTRRSYQGIQFNSGASQAIVHTSSQGILNLQNCTFTSSNANVMTLGANITSNAFNYINLCDFTGSSGPILLANNANNIFTATTTSNSSVLTATSIDPNTMTVGQLLTGIGIPAGSIYIARLSSTSLLMNYNATASGSGVTIYRAVAWYCNMNNGLNVNIGNGHIVFGYNNQLVTLSGNTTNYLALDKPTVTTVATQTLMLAQSYINFAGIGCLTTVNADINPNNNGIWQCKALPISTLANWVQISQQVPSGTLYTYLTTNMTNVSTTATVNSTNGFSATGGTLWIVNEAMTYTGTTSTTFTGLTRGINGTTAVAHTVGNIVSPIGSGGAGASFETNTANVQMDGTVSVGTLSTTLRADHVHPTDTSRAGLASNNAFVGNNSYSGSSTFSTLTNASGNYTPLVLDSSNVLRKEPPSASISATIIAFQNTPPVSPNDGDTYVVGTSPTGAWVSQANAITEWNGSAWGFVTPTTGLIVASVNGNGYQWNGTAWVNYVITGNTITTQTTTTTTTIATWNTILYVNATSSNVVVTLPLITAATASTSITVNRIDNNSQYNVMILPAGGNTINGNPNTFLYAQNNSLTFANDGVSVARIVSQVDNTSISYNKTYLQAYVYNQTTGFATGNPILYNNNPNTTGFQSYGSNILMLTNGQFLLKAGSTYRLKATAGLCNIGGSNGFINFQWYNVTTSTLIGSSGCGINDNASFNHPSNPVAEAIITTTVDTTVQVNMYVPAALTFVFIGDQALGTAGNRFGVAYIEQIATPANIINVIDNIYALLSSNVTSSANTNMNFNNIITGNMTASSGVFTLKGGRTYWLESVLGLASGGGVYVQYQWVDATTNTPLTGSTQGFNVGNSPGGYSPSSFAPTVCTYTPSINQTVKVRTLSVCSNTANAIQLTMSYVRILQLGSSQYLPNNSIPQLSKSSDGSFRGVLFIYKNQLWQMGVAGMPGSSTSISANTNIPNLVPINNSGAIITGWQDVVYGYDSAIALTNDGRVFYWGHNSITSSFQPYATLIAGLSSVIVNKIYCVSNRSGSVAHNSFFCITNTGTVYSFGDNTWGQLGINNTTAQSTAQLIGGVLTGKVITKISVSGNSGIHVAAIDSTGQLYTWGYGAQGTAPVCNPLGTGVANTGSSIPVAISGFTNVIDVVAASEYANSVACNFTRVLRSNGSSWATGANAGGQLANGTTTSTSSFVRESLNKTNIRAIYGFETFSGGASVIIDSAGILYFSGNNNDACFGDGSTVNSAHTTFTNTTQLNNAPFQGKMLMGAAGIQPKVAMLGTANGGCNTCFVLDNTGTVYAAGRYQEGQTGNPNSSTSTAFLPVLTNAKNVPVVDIKVVGYPVTGMGLLMLFQDGTMMTCGTNESSLGNETVPTNVAVPYGRYVIGFSIPPVI